MLLGASFCFFLVRSTTLCTHLGVHLLSIDALFFLCSSFMHVLVCFLDIFFVCLLLLPTYRFPTLRGICGLRRLFLELFSPVCFGFSVSYEHPLPPPVTCLAWASDKGVRHMHTYTCHAAVHGGCRDGAEAAPAPPTSWISPVFPIAALTFVAGAPVHVCA